MSIRIEALDDKFEWHRSEQIWLLPRSSVPFYVRDPSTGYRNDFTRYLGCFVTPNAPSIQKFRQLATKYHPDQKLQGYQSDVILQVKAIFELIKRDSAITMIVSSFSFEPESGRPPRIRLPSETLEDQSATSIDASVLFASLLEATRLNPALVVLPGHVLVAWETNSDSGEWVYLETTMISTHTFEEATEVANHKIKRWLELAGMSPNAIKIWSIRDLRTRYGIAPIE